jgi:hypothetical protein
MKVLLLAACALLVTTGAWAQRDTSAPSAGQDLRRSSITGAGTDACAQWKLSGKQLAECRRAWMDAKTDADRLEVRHRYEHAIARRPMVGDKSLSPEQVDNTTMCDGWKLSAPDLSSCRAEVKSANTDTDFARIRAKYEPGQRKPQDSRVKTSGPVGPGREPNDPRAQSKSPD